MYLYNRFPRCVKKLTMTFISFKGGWEIPKLVDLDEIRSFEVYPDDVFIVTQPKCGTTWMQELTWLIANDLDLEGAKSNQFFRVPFLEIQGLVRRRAYNTKGVSCTVNKRMLELRVQKNCLSIFRSMHIMLKHNTYFSTL